MAQSSEEKIAHLEMVQGVISRLANNSSSMKSLSGTIVAAAIALYGTISNATWPYLLGATLPVIMFWLLDAQYLKIEYAYRHLYDAIRNDQHTEKFSMDYKTFSSQTPCFGAIFFSWSVGLLYAVLLAGIGLIAVSKGFDCHASKLTG